MKSLKKQLFLAMFVGFVLGTLWLIVVRFVNYERDEVHYHANFAVYIDGQREEFDSFTFYEEVQSCGSDALNNPHTRVHMHDQINHVVHVHDNAATWGHFFANLGYVLGNDVLRTDRDIFSEDEGGELIFILNGTEAKSIANQTIRSEDALIISYTSPGYTESDLDIVQEPEDMAMQKYEELQKDAADYNLRDDPSACTGGKPTTFQERLKHALGFGQ